MITLSHIRKQFGSKILFNDASLQIGVRDRIGLVGLNGSGKTTLFRMILGIEPVDEGEIRTAKGARIGFLPQEIVPFTGHGVLEEVLKSATGISTLQDKMKILEEELASIEDPGEQERLAKEYGKLQHRYTVLGGYGLEAEAKRILQGLGFKERDFLKATDDLSGGWLMRMALCKILLQSPDLLLLDEPTNYLDLESLIWLENFLVGHPGAVVVVSHDRVFLNHVVLRIAEIENQKIDLYHGDYDHFVEEKEHRKRVLEATFMTQQRKIEQTERFIERFRAKNTKARQVQSRIKMLEKLERIELPTQKKEIRFRFPSPKRSGHKVVELRDLHKSYDGLTVYQGIDLVLLRGDKVALIGPNGAGKSTLLKILAGAVNFEKGEMDLGKDVTRAYFAQHQFDLLRPERTVFGELLSIASDESQTELRTLLGTFLFSGEEIEKRISVLSGGEKSRLVLAKMLLKPANFLLLDEPTSHLDIPSRNVLEAALKQFQGTICLISHDRHLINQVANKIIEIDRGELCIFPGNYDYYIYKKHLMDKGGHQTDTRTTHGQNVLSGLRPSSGGGGGAREHPASPDKGDAIARKALDHGPGQLESLISVKKQSSYKTKEERRREALVKDQFRRHLSGLQKQLREVERSLNEATEQMDHLTRRLSDASLYLNQKETYETIQNHQKVKERVKELSHHWESLALQLEELGERGNMMGK